MTNLTLFLSNFDKSSPKSILSTLNYLTRQIRPSNINTIVPFLLNLKDVKLSLPNHFIRSGNYAIAKLLEKLRITEFKYKSLIDQIFLTIETKSKDENVAFNLHNSIINIIFPLLLRVSYKEFENVIHSYYNKKEIKYPLENNLLMIHESKSKKNICKSYYSLITMLSRDDLTGVIDYFVNTIEDANPFFVVMYLTNEILYKQLCDVVFENYGHNNFVLKALPEINTPTLSDAMIKYLVENRPVQLERVINLLSENRGYLVNLVKEFYDIFDVSSLKLTFEENLIISENNDKHALELLKSVMCEEMSDDKIKGLLDMLSHKDLAFLKHFIESVEVTKTFEDVILNLAKQKRLLEQVHKTLETRFIDNPNNCNKDFVKQLFFSISFYLDSDKIIKNLEPYLKNEDDLRSFLRVLTPIDIMYNIHYFRDIENSLLASTIITPRKEIFNEQICMCVIQKMEENVLPPIFMRTVMLSLINFPTLKKFTIDLCFRLIKYEIWTMPRLYNGYIKCLGFLGSSCAEIVMAMPRDRMKEIFARNEKVLRICENWVRNNGSIRGSYAFSFKDAIYYQLSKSKNK